MMEYVDIVNDNALVVGKTTREEVHTKGWLHPTVNILLFNSVGKVLLQKRSKNKLMFPLCWDVSVCEHVFSQEAPRQAAIRGLWEELSIKARMQLLRNNHIKISQYPIKNKILIECELVKLYGGFFDGEINIDRVEVVDTMFVTISKLKGLIYQSKIPFTPWGLDELLFLVRNHKQILKKISRIK